MIFLEVPHVSTAEITTIIKTHIMKIEIKIIMYEMKKVNNMNQRINKFLKNDSPS